MKLTLALAATAMLLAMPLAHAASPADLNMDGKISKIEMEKFRVHLMDKDNKEHVVDFLELCGPGVQISEDKRDQAAAACGMFKTMKENDDVSVTFAANPNPDNSTHGSDITAMKK